MGVFDAHAADDGTAVPVTRMLRLTAEAVAERAAPLAAGLRDAGFDADVVDGLSTIGGGSAPGATLATALVRLRHPSLSADGLERRLRRLDPPVVARIENDAVVLDLRTVLPGQDAALLDLLSPLGPGRLSETGL